MFETFLLYIYRQWVGWQIKKERLIDKDVNFSSDPRENKQNMLFLILKNLFPVQPFIMIALYIVDLFGISGFSIGMWYFKFFTLHCQRNRFVKSTVRDALCHNLKDHACNVLRAMTREILCPSQLKLGTCSWVFWSVTFSILNWHRVQNSFLWAV